MVFPFPELSSVFWMFEGQNISFNCSGKIGDYRHSKPFQYVTAAVIKSDWRICFSLFEGQNISSTVGEKLENQDVQNIEIC